MIENTANFSEKLENEMNDLVKFYYFFAFSMD